jgi:hypothetical protein
MSIEVVSQCESVTAVIAAVRPGMAFVMTTYVLSVSAEHAMKAIETLLELSTRSISLRTPITLDKTIDLTIRVHDSQSTAVDYVSACGVSTLKGYKILLEKPGIERYLVQYPPLIK